jgi:type I restriction enzyme R subunit
MSNIGEIERHTQNRIIKLFKEQLGYTYLGNWEDRPNNANIDVNLLNDYLINTAKYPKDLVNRAVYLLHTEALSFSDMSLYQANKNVYEKIRYGEEILADAGSKFERVHFIDFDHPERNHFAIAEEVTIRGNRDKRPDIVLYINGIAIGIIELKRSTISIGHGIRQNITNQQPEFIEQFFTTTQLLFAGNDSEGLRYGAIGTPEKHYYSWKEDIDDNSLLPLDKYLLKLCNKERILEIIRDFVVFDGGKKKLPRYHQYFGIKKAQEHVRRREGGIIWHTQGSGKSIVMVILAQWILKTLPSARVVIITDRTELDKQIERVFNDSGETVKRTQSGEELMEQLSQPMPRLICSLIHKFGRRNVTDIDAYIEELNALPSQAIGDVFVFVDECHRTNSNTLHKLMKATIRNGVFIGFTGTPLLKQDKATSLEVFGKYIHTYKFNEAVTDEVVLDLVYEARDIDQRLSSPDRIDQWFEAKTRGLNDFQRSELKKKWGTMQKVLSSQSRIDRVIADIVFDFNTKPRLNSNQGNAIIVAGSILEACKYFNSFQNTEFKGRCAIITSYNPSTKDIVTEDTGANTETDKEIIFNTYTKLLENVVAQTGKSQTETYEDRAKSLFLNEPATMRLLIVVDKLLTGFDAPSCSYLYIDKNMQDHGLFQAICRVNRLDTDDKQFGYIVDYKDLFRKVENAVAVYTSELDYDNFEKEDCDILLKDRIALGRERLDNAMEQIELLCEPVAPPKGKLENIHYFCGNMEIPEELKATEVRRNALYKASVAFIRAYANIAEDLDEAAYTTTEQNHIKSRLDHYLKLREEIRLASGETLDMKAYEADMRHLIDTYIQADEPRIISPFGDMPLIELIVKSGIADAIDTLPKGIRESRESIAETIANNVRQKIIKDHLIDPTFFEEMSTLLQEVIIQRRENAISYEEYLQKIADIASRIMKGSNPDVPSTLKTSGQKALYNNLNKNEDLALQIHKKVMSIKPDGWHGSTPDSPKSRIIKQGLFEILKDADETERIFNILYYQPEYH